MDTGRLLLRSTLGPLFIGHGTQKLFGWFGGHGPEGTGAFFESVGLRPGQRHALAAGAAEAGGGLLITLGFLTPVAAATITGAMFTAIRKVHLKSGVWVSNGGFEYNAVIIAAVAVLAEQGPGWPSVDAVLFPRFKGPQWAALAVAAGVTGSFLNELLFSEPAPEADGADATADGSSPSEPAGGPEALADQAGPPSPATGEA